MTIIEERAVSATVLPVLHKGQQELILHHNERIQ
jgi:hypothetical protein